MHIAVNMPSVVNNPKNISFSHLEHLSPEDRRRYVLKLTVNGEELEDPFRISENLWQNNVAMWPEVQYGDIYNYLINTPGLYTAEAMKAYKSLDGYNFFVSGHVHEVLFYQVNESICFLKSTIIPSQKITDKKQWHKAWVCVHRSKGTIISAHCTCKAGLGEACSHVAAMLFKVEAAVKLDLTNTSRTSAACVWNRYYREKITAEPLSEMSFSRPKHGRVIKRKTNHVTVNPNTDSDDEFDEEAALRSLKRICPEACILTKDDSDTDTASDDEEMPPVLVRAYSIGSELSGEALAAECRTFLEDFSVSPTQASNLEKMTRNQAESGLWKRQRFGRITASICHDVKTRKECTDPEKLIQRIIGGNSDLSSIPSIRYGVTNEKRAKKQYCEVMCREHDNFLMRDSGLMIDTTFPMFAASPDGVRTCDCHGEGLLEVKCVYKHRDLSVADIPDCDNQFFLTKSSLNLKENHKYYSQVQFQMFVTQKQFCDFVVFTDKGIFTQTIYYNSMYVRELVERCTSFAFNHLLPSLIVKKMEGEDSQMEK